MIAAKDLEAVQTLVVRAPHGPEVAHLVLTIPARPNAGRDAFALLKDTQPSFGAREAHQPCCSIGFSYAGLERLGLPIGYLRVFRRTSPAFADGAPLRAARRGDGYANEPDKACPEFTQQRAHVLVSWHGPAGETLAQAQALAGAWSKHFQTRPDEAVSALHQGQRLGAPPEQTGEWMHFGYRDGLSEVCIEEHAPPGTIDPRHHAPGVLLHGHVNDAGYNPYALSQAPDKVRAFFRNASFGVLRPMQQDLSAFQKKVDEWAVELAAQYPRPVTPAFVKAKLCGRWPNGVLLTPEVFDEPPAGSLALPQDPFTDGDAEGYGCPYGAHVRRMRAAPDANGRIFARTLQRRSVPYGKALWSNRPAPGDNEERGLLGHFFCASIEDQFEHLLGQWAARPPLGFAADDSAADPLLGPHADGGALRVPLEGKAPAYLSGFRRWTSPLGTMYAWYPSCCALWALRYRDYEPEDTEGPWR